MASIKQRPDGQWRARYRDDAGKEHARHFARKLDARRWLDEVTTAVVTGQYVDPRSGRITFRQYAEQWRSGQVHRPSTQAYIERQLRRHAYTVFGDRPMSSIKPSEIQIWTKRLTERLAPSTVGIVHGIVSGIFRAAVRDRVIMHNPCDGTKLPKVTKSRVEPLATEVVLALADAVPDRYRALVILSGGSGMRQGECFGLTVDRIDFLRRTVLVDRQLVTISGRPPFLAPPKTAASVRSIPLPTVVVDALAAHLAAYPPLEDGFVFVTDAGRPIRRTALGDVWRAAVKAAGAPVGTGFHELRHYYASLLIRHGESVKVVQARLGHASAGETLDTYSHLWPDSDDRTRTAVDSVLSADSVRTGEVVDGHNP
jgi:integrase